MKVAVAFNCFITLLIRLSFHPVLSEEMETTMNPEYSPYDSTFTPLSKCCPPGQGVQWTTDEGVSCVVLEDLQDFSFFSQLPGQFNGHRNETEAEFEMPQKWTEGDFEQQLDCESPLVPLLTFPYQLALQLGSSFPPPSTPQLKNLPTDIQFLQNGQIWFRVSSSEPWLQMTGNFCVDGLLFNNKKPEEGQNQSSNFGDVSRLFPPGQFIIKFCVEPYKVVPRVPKALEIYLTADGWIVIFVLFIHVLIYGLLWKEQNLHGWCVTMFCLSGFMWYVNNAIGDNINYWLIAYEDWPLDILMLRGVAYHYWYMAYYFWLAVVSFDVLTTIRSMTPGVGRSKGRRKFLYYCCVGFGGPVILVAIGLTIEFSFGVFDERVVRPEYAAYSFIRWDKNNSIFYVGIPFTILCIFNVCCGLRAVLFVCKAQRERQNLQSSRKKQSLLAQISRVGKLSILCGMSMLLEFGFAFINWQTYVAYPALVTFRFALRWTIVHEPLIMFYVLVCRREIRDQLSAKYAVCKWAFSKIDGWKKICCCCCTSGSQRASGRGHDEMSRTTSTTSCSTTTTDSQVLETPQGSQKKPSENI